MKTPSSNGPLILGIESSCDDTAAAVVRGGRDVLSSVVRSQNAEHAMFGGVVPEIAGRSHLRNAVPIVNQALEQAGVRLEDVDAIAVTNRPGLIGSLLVGVSLAKSLAWSLEKPIIGIHHIEAHAYSATMEHDVEFPALALVVSGGHTALYRMPTSTRLERVCETLDDAAGEAFDKVAQMLGLGYPGGPEISRLAAEGDPHKIRFPRYRSKDGKPGFSFSGLKTAVLYHLRGQNALAPTPAPEDIPDRADVAASFEQAVVDALVTQTLQAAEEAGTNSILIAGGVACNARLREQMAAAGEERGLRTYFPSPRYCADNAAMIGGLGGELFEAGVRSDLGLDAEARA